jgi:ABC-type uncharacterized transport system ATPase subunit
MSIVIQTEGLSKTFTSYEKAEGLKQSFKGFFKRKSIEKVALSPTTLSIDSGQWGRQDHTFKIALGPYSP